MNGGRWNSLNVGRMKRTGNILRREKRKERKILPAAGKLSRTVKRVDSFSSKNKKRHSYNLANLRPKSGKCRRALFLRVMEQLWTYEVYADHTQNSTAPSYLILAILTFTGRKHPAQEVFPHRKYDSCCCCCDEAFTL